MFRNALLWASVNPFLAERLPKYGFFRRATRRFMPGETLRDALDAAERLWSMGLSTTLTVLGENVATPADADSVVTQYLEMLEAIRSTDLDTEVSLKLTQLGLDLGVDEARARLSHVVRVCGPGAMVWIDMESSAYVERTLDVFRAVRGEFPNVGLCLQAYLKRTEADLESLLPLEPAIRLVKGAYLESPEVAFPKKEDVDQNYLRLTSTLMRARKDGRAGRPVFGTHDARMINEANRIGFELGLAKDSYELAMLYGIRAQEQERLVRTGHSVRILISYGSAWFRWYVRRLAERPANVWFVAKQILG